MVIGEAGDPGAYVTMEERRLEGGHVTIQLHSLEEDFVLVHLEIQQVVHVMEDGDAVTLQASVMLVKEIVTLILTVKVDSSVELTTVELGTNTIVITLIVAINQVPGVHGVLGRLVMMEEEKSENAHVKEEDLVLDLLQIEPAVHVMEDGDAVPLQISVMLVKEIVTRILTVKVDSSVEVTTVNHLPGTSILMGLIVAINHHHQVKIKY